MTDLGIVDISGVSHIGLCVSNFETSLRFYPDGIRIELVQENP